MSTDKAWDAIEDAMREVFIAGADWQKDGRSGFFSDAVQAAIKPHKESPAILAAIVAQGTSASGQDGNRLGAQPAGPVGETDAPIPQSTSPQPIPAEGGVKP